MKNFHKAFKFGELRLFIGTFSDHGFLQSPKRTIYGFGSNSSCVLGTVFSTTQIGRSDLKHIPFFDSKRVLNIGCGARFSVFLTSRGLYTCGEPTALCVKTDVIDHVLTTTSKYLQTPQSIDYFAIQGLTVTNIYVGRDCAFFQIGGEVWATGRSASKLGIGKKFESGYRWATNTSTEKTNLPEKVQIAEDLKSVCCGGEHTMFLSVLGRVYAAGSNYYGRMAIAPKETSFTAVVPVLVTSVKCRVKAIGTGDHFSILLTEDNSLLFTGKLLSRTSDIPTVLSENVRAFSAGRNHLMFQNADGKVFSNGYTGDGRCGIGVTSSKLELLPVVGLPAKFTKYDIFASSNNTFCVDVCGYGVYGTGRATVLMKKKSVKTGQDQLGFCQMLCEELQKQFRKEWAVTSGRGERFAFLCSLKATAMLYNRLSFLLFM